MVAATRTSTPMRMRQTDKENAGSPRTAKTPGSITKERRPGVYVPPCRVALRRSPRQTSRLSPTDAAKPKRGFQGVGACVPAAPPPNDPRSSLSAPPLRTRSDHNTVGARRMQT